MRRSDVMREGDKRVRSLKSNISHILQYFEKSLPITKFEEKKIP